jgi:hypothetical protein
MKSQRLGFIVGHSVVYKGYPAPPEEIYFLIQHVRDITVVPVVLGTPCTIHTEAIFYLFNGPCCPKTVLLLLWLNHKQAKVPTNTSFFQTADELSTQVRYCTYGRIISSLLPFAPLLIPKHLEVKALLINP